MRLKFISNHLSIEQFNSVEMPNFVVLTGVNGSGKSHLLEAIEQRKVVFEEITNARVVRFNYESFKLENEGRYGAQAISQERTAAWQFFRTNLFQTLKHFKEGILNSQSNYSTISKACIEQKTPLMSSKGINEVESYRKQIDDYFNHQNYQNNAHAQSIRALIDTLPFSIDDLTEAEFMSRYKPYNLKNNFLPQEIGKIIWDYYFKLAHNNSNEFQSLTKGKELAYLTEEEFTQRFGPKPWELINEILAEFSSLNYKLNTPEDYDPFDHYQLKLVHKNKPNLEIDFSSLSSGEKILMALVATIYKTRTDGIFPDVLLLDELDASLHPSMMKSMLTVINNVFLSRGMQVILVSHSPTTIALSPEESIFLMNREGEDRIVKASPKEALVILTEGFATLDEGITIFDEAIKSPLSIITEGKNAQLIRKALELNGMTNINVITGFEGSSGKDQLKTLYHFFSKANIKSKVVFVWDCDVNYNLTSSQNVHAYILPKNLENTFVPTGIENMFPPELFVDFTITTTYSNGHTIKQFDHQRKSDFCDFILKRNTQSDFLKFEPLFTKVKELI